MLFCLNLLGDAVYVPSGAQLCRWMFRLCCQHLFKRGGEVVKVPECLLSAVPFVDLQHLFLFHLRSPHVFLFHAHTALELDLDVLIVYDDPLDD